MDAGKAQDGSAQVDTSLLLEAAWGEILLPLAGGGKERV